MQHEGADRHARELRAELPRRPVRRFPPPSEKRRQQAEREQEEEQQSVGEDEIPELAGRPQIRFQPPVHDVPGELETEVVGPYRIGDAGHHQAGLRIRERNHFEEVRGSHEG